MKVDPRMRPPLDVSVRLSQVDVLTRFRGRLAHRECPVDGSVLGRHIELRPHRTDRHYWSPCLSLDVDASDEGCRVHGRFGPHPHVWTLFVAGYAILGALVIGGAVYGLAQITSNREPWALWCVPLGLGPAALLYALALTGRRLGASQMTDLERFVRQIAPLAASPATASRAPSMPASRVPT